MTLKQRLLAVGAAVALLFSGMAFGRLTDSPKSTSADEVKTSLTESPKAGSDAESFYLKDFKTGYDEGFAAGQTGQTSSIVATDREGYNEGFKKGYADAYQAAYGGEDGVPGGHDPTPFATGPMVPAAPEERGFKDTVKANPGYFTTIRARFELPAGVTAPQDYVHHCHIVTIRGNS